MAKTKREYFHEILTIVADNEELTAFVNKEIALLDRKSSRAKKPTPTQIENEGFKADILTALDGVEPVTITGLVEICPSLAGLKNQRITHLLTALREDGKVKRTYVKKVAHFALGNEKDEA